MSELFVVELWVQALLGASFTFSLPFVQKKLTGRKQRLLSPLLDQMVDISSNRVVKPMEKHKILELPQKNTSQCTYVIFLPVYSLFKIVLVFFQGVKPAPQFRCLVAKPLQ